MPGVRDELHGPSCNDGVGGRRHQHGHRQASVGTGPGRPSAHRSDLADGLQATRGRRGQGTDVARQYIRPLPPAVVDALVSDPLIMTTSGALRVESGASRVRPSPPRPTADPRSGEPSLTRFRGPQAVPGRARGRRGLVPGPAPQAALPPAGRGPRRRTPRRSAGVAARVGEHGSRSCQHACVTVQNCKEPLFPTPLSRISQHHRIICTPRTPRGRWRRRAPAPRAARPDRCGRCCTAVKTWPSR